MWHLISSGSLFPFSPEQGTKRLFRGRIRKLLLLQGILVFAILLLALSARAYVLDFDKISEIPQHDSELSEEEFNDRTGKFRVRPRGDKHLEFSISLPNDWSRTRSDLSTISRDGEEINEGRSSGLINQKLLGRVAKFTGPPRMDFISFLEVEALELEYDISTRNWLLSYIINQGITLQGMREVNDNRFEILFNTVREGVPYVVRMLAEANGTRVGLVSYYVPEKYWKEERAMQEQVVNSFEFLNPEVRNIEKTATYQFLDLLRFDYPVSWRLLAPNIYSTDGMEARIVNTPDGQTLHGEIKLTILSTELDVSMPEEIGYIREDLNKMGIMIDNLKGDISDILEYTYYDHIFWHQIEIYNTERGKKKIQDHEFWIGIFVEERFYYFITMLTPSRESDFLNWARNIEAYQTVISSIRP